MFRTISKVWFAAGLGWLMAGTVEAQLTNWKLGGSGLEWSESDSVNVLIDFESAPGAIQPIYLTPDRTVFSLLENWQTWRDPSDKILGYVDRQMPRVWKGFHGIPDPSEDGSRLIDGDSTTYNLPIAEGGVAIEFFTFDLAVPLPAFQFGFFTPSVGFRVEGTPLKTDAMPAFDVSIGGNSDPAIPKGGNHLLETVVADVAENLDPTVHIDFPRQYVRFIRWRRQLSILDEEILTRCIDCGGAQGNQSRGLKGTIGDFELFALGVPQRAVYKSGIIDLGQMANFGRLHWSITPMRMADGMAVEDPDADVSIEVQVRTGRDDDPAVYHEFTNTGLEGVVSRERYEDLKPRLHRQSGTGYSFVTREPKPGVRASIGYDAGNWTYWSASFFEPGQPLRLRSGSHIQFTITLESRDFDAWVRLDSLWIETAPLLAGDVFGEVARLDDPQPARGFTEVELGAMTDFVYDLQAVFGESDAPGFDTVRIRTGNQAEFRHLEMGAPLARIEPTQVVEEEDGLVIHLPEKVTRRRNQPIRVIFGTEVFEFATTFEGEVFAMETETLPQLIVSGDVSEALSTNSLRVLSAPGKSPDFIQELSFSTPVLTPNGDGIHDELEITYSLFRLPERVPVLLEVYTLDGRPVYSLVVDEQDSGPQRITWNGRSGDSGLLPPGIYLTSISLETEFSTSREMRPLGIAY